MYINTFIHTEILLVQNNIYQLRVVKLGHHDKIHAKFTEKSHGSPLCLRRDLIIILGLRNSGVDLRVTNMTNFALRLGKEIFLGETINFVTIIILYFPVK